MVFTKSYLSYLSWKTTCLEIPLNLVVALYRFHCTILITIQRSIKLSSDIDNRYPVLNEKESRLRLWKKIIHLSLTKSKHYLRHQKPKIRYWYIMPGWYDYAIYHSHSVVYYDGWRGALMFSLICAWTHVWADHRDAGNLRRHRAHYDVTALGIPLYCMIHVDPNNGTLYVHSSQFWCY